MRKAGLEKKAHIINFSTKKNINVEIFYSFLTSALFESKYHGHLSEDILELMLPYDYDTTEKLQEKYMKISKKYPNILIEKSEFYFPISNFHLKNLTFRKSNQGRTNKFNRINLHLRIKIFFQGRFADK